MEMENKINCFSVERKNVIIVSRRRDMELNWLPEPYNGSGEDSANDVVSLELSDTEISSDDDEFSISQDDVFSISQDDPLEQFDTCSQSDFTLDSERVLSDVLYRDWAKLRGAAAAGLITKQFSYCRNSQGAGHALEDRWLLPVLLRPTTPSSDRLFIKLIPRRLAGKHTLSCHRVDKTLLLPNAMKKKSDDEDHMSDFSIPRVPSEPGSDTCLRTAGQKCSHAASERSSNKANSGSDISRKSHNQDIRAHIRRTAEHRNALAQEGMKIEERNRIRVRDARNRADHQENTQQSDQSDQSMPMSSADGDSGSNDSDSKENANEKPSTPPGNDTSEGDNNAGDESAQAVSVTDASARGKTPQNSIGATNSSIKESEDLSKHSTNDLSMFKIQNAEYDFLNFYRSIYKYEVEPEIEALLQKKVLDCAKIAKAEMNDFDKGNEGGDEEDEDRDEEDLDCKIDLVKGSWETLRMVHEVGQEGMFNEAYGSYDKVIKTFMDSASVYLGLEDPNLRGRPTETEDHLHSRFLTSEVALPSMGSDMIIGLRRSDAFTNQNTGSTMPTTTTEQTLTNHGISNGNSSNNTNKQSSGNSNENGSTGNCNSGNGNSSNGNGHSSNGNGHSSNGNGHSSNGNGHSSNGNGNSSNGNGHSSNGHGNSSNCNENSSDRNGHSSNGKVENSSNGNGNGSNNECNLSPCASRIMYGENRSYVPPCRHAIEDRIGEISDNALFGSDSNCSIEIDDDSRTLRGIPGTFPHMWDTMDS